MVRGMARSHSAQRASRTGGLPAAGLVCTLALCWVITVGCSHAGRDRLKQFFFEIPEEQTGASSESLPDSTVPVPESPQLLLPGPRFVSTHPPFALRQCSECHDTGNTMEVGTHFMDSCGTCHPRYYTEDVRHEPVSQGECVACHTMHRSKHVRLLLMPVSELCIDCHEEPEDLSESAHSGDDAGQCLLCHDPHFGAEKLLRPEVE